MSLSSDTGSKVITASCTLLSPSLMSDGTCPLSPAAVQAITVHTSSEKIIVPVAAVSASLNKHSSSLPADGDQITELSDTFSSATVVAGSREKHGASAADAVSQKTASQKTGLSNIVTRRVRFQAKPNISKNARVR